MFSSENTGHYRTIVHACMCMLHAAMAQSPERASCAMCSLCPRVQVFLLLRGTMLCLMLGSNGVMLTAFAKAMQRCGSTAEAVSANSAANFILTVSSTAPRGNHT